MNAPPTITIAQAIQVALELHRRGQPSHAQTICSQVLQSAPNHPDALYLLSVIAQQGGDPDKAISFLEQAILANPAVSDLHNQMGMLCFQAGRTAQAMQHFCDAIALEPGFAEAHNNLGNLLKFSGEIDKAMACYRLAQELKPDFAEACNNLGVACMDAGNFDEAIRCWERALALKSGFSETHNNLGNVLRAQGRLEAAIVHYRNAISLKPDYAEAHNNLGVALMELGHIEEATVCLREAIARNPGYATAFSNLLLCTHYALSPTPKEIALEHLRYSEHIELPLLDGRLPHNNTPVPERRLKIGYLSPDFRKHSVAYFIEPVLAHHDQSQVEVFCYYHHRQHDAVTERLASHAEHWLSCHELSDEQLARRIREDGIDILVDLAGHTAGNRLPLFARKPAPVQVTYLGYPDTTGLTAMDYRLTDAHADPWDENPGLCTEKLVRLPGTFLCYRPGAKTPEVSALPLARRGQVTFGSFNSLAKVPSMIETWARILRSLPNSRLMIKSGNLHGEEEEKLLSSRFAEYGVGAERLLLLGREASTERHLSRYGEMDIALDSFPYNGTTTTCEALWMGVPVVTLTGNRHASRVGASLLNNLGLSELIAKSPEEYLSITLGLASDPEKLSHLRQTMRQRMLESPLMNEKTFTANLETAYRQIWRKWCSAQ